MSLSTKGYEIRRQAINTRGLDMFRKFLDDFDEWSHLLSEGDIFKTEDGKIKQIQNLHEVWLCEQPLRIILEHCLGFKGKILNSQFFIKHPGYKITSPHQDGAYFDDTSADIYTAWIPLQDVDENNSTMFYKDWNGNREIFHHQDCGSNIRTRTGKTGKSQFLPQENLNLYHPVILNYGDCVIHNQFCEHYSSQNLTNEKRVALTIIFQTNH